uniref:Uncharacterized protein n=1 Tax=Globodera rostochiensis TaxID=31243 RepID=A0A914HS55_GLORO
MNKSTGRTPNLDKLNPIQVIRLDKLNPIQVIRLDKLNTIQLISLDKLNTIQLIRILLSQSGKVNLAKPHNINTPTANKRN